MKKISGVLSNKPDNNEISDQKDIKFKHGEHDRKVIVLGDSNTGKSCFVSKYMTGNFREGYGGTIGGL